MSNYTELFIFSSLFLYSCFANVVLQCLTYTQPLAAYLLEGVHSEHCKYILSFNYTCVTTICTSFIEQRTAMFDV